MADITDKYTRQVSRPDDIRRASQEEERKNSLAEHAEQDPEPIPTAEVWDAAFEMVGVEVENVGETGGKSVNDAIVQATQNATAAVNNALMTKEQRQAEAFVDALEKRGAVVGDLTTKQQEAYEASLLADPEETERLNAELELTGDDPEVGEDEDGNTIYQDATG